MLKLTAKEPPEEASVEFAVTLTALSLAQFDESMRNEFVASIAANLGVASSAVVVSAARAGSIIVEVCVVAPDSDLLTEKLLVPTSTS